MGKADLTGEQRHPRSGRIRTVFRWIRRIFGVLLVLLLVVFLYLFSGALYRRFVEYPRQAEAWEHLRAQRQPVELDDGWTEYRGILHTHSHFSHDSMVSFPEILAAAKKADISFVFMSDHCVDGKADYSLQWKGLHDGVLFVRGFEMGYGFMPWGLPDDTVLERSKPPAELAQEIAERGGVLFFAHSEEPREWDLPQLVGMEIYNIHTDFQNVDFADLVPDILVSIRRYGDHVFRRVFEPQTEILAKWDDLNRTRKIVGIGANDCHQNLGIRGFYTDRDTLLIRSTASDDPEDLIGELDLNFFTRPLLRLFCGPLEPGKQAFRIDIDPYDRSMRFVNTHILARELSEPALLDGLKAGRVFVAFDMIADARGFAFFAEAQGRKAVMGETVATEPGDIEGVKLVAASPLESRLTLLRDGERVDAQVARVAEWNATEPGHYRVEAEVKLGEEWIPWVYTNPITVETPAPAG